MLWILFFMIVVPLIFLAIVALIEWSHSVDDRQAWENRHEREEWP